MFSLAALFRAIGRLAGAVDALAETFETTNQGLRGRLGLDASEGPELLAHGPEANGDEAEPEEAAGARKGRRK